MLPMIKVDADSKNIEEIEVRPDETRYVPRLSAERKRNSPITISNFRTTWG